MGSKVRNGSTKKNDLSYKVELVQREGCVELKVGHIDPEFLAIAKVHHVVMTFHRAYW